MADNQTSSQYNPTPPISTSIEEAENGHMAPQSPPIAHLVPGPSSSTITERPPPPPRARASLRVDAAAAATSSEEEGHHIDPLHSRRVRFNPEVSQRTSLVEGDISINPLNLVSPFRTPPIAVTCPGEEFEVEGSYFDSVHGQKISSEEDDVSTPLPSPLPKNKRRTSRHITFEEEVRAAIGGMSGEKLEGLSSEGKKNIMAMLGSYSAPASVHTSPITTPRISLDNGVREEIIANLDGVRGIPPLDPEKNETSRPEGSKNTRTRPTSTAEAHKLVRAHTTRSHNLRFDRKKPTKDLESGASTPVEGETSPSHEQIRAGVLSSLLKLYNHSNPLSHGQGSSRPTSPGASGRTTPKWYTKSANSSVTSLLGLGLMGSNQTLMAAGTPGGSRAGSPTGLRTPKYKKRHSGGFSGMLNKIYSPRSNVADEIRITIHIAKLLSRQQYVLKLCRALMLYGVSADPPMLQVSQTNNLDRLQHTVWKSMSK